MSSKPTKSTLCLNKSALQKFRGEKEKQVAEALGIPKKFCPNTTMPPAILQFRTWICTGAGSLSSTGRLTSQWTNTRNITNCVVPHQLQSTGGFNSGMIISGNLRTRFTNKCNSTPHTMSIWQSVISTCAIRSAAQPSLLKRTWHHQIS